jgi:hypothetical protein
MPGIGRHPSLQALGLAPGARRRVWTGLLLVALALASFMHVAHSHDADTPSIHKHQCSFCSTFDRGSAPPPASIVASPTAPAPSCVASLQQVPVVRAGLHRAGQPRAPPALQA